MTDMPSSVLQQEYDRIHNVLLASFSDGLKGDLASCTWMFPEVTSGGAVLISPSVVDLGLTAFL